MTWTQSGWRCVCHTAVRKHLPVGSDVCLEPVLSNDWSRSYARTLRYCSTISSSRKTEHGAVVFAIVAGQRHVPRHCKVLIFPALTHTILLQPLVLSPGGIGGARSRQAAHRRLRVGPAALRELRLCSACSRGDAEVSAVSELAARYGGHSDGTAWLCTSCGASPKQPSGFALVFLRCSCSVRSLLALV
jgi:hypothetical protein